MRKRILSLLLCVVMLFSLCPQSALAVGNGQMGGVTIGASGLCEHHPEHNADCGYAEGTAGTPCGHEHTEDCYILVTECVHEHDEGCYPEESVSGNEATPSDAQNREPVNCPHICGEESGCITKKLDCQHEHDGECGYSPAIEGTPCGYVCELCSAGDNGENGEQPETECICTSLCNTETIEEDCPVCGAENADLTLCEGERKTATPSNAETVTVTSVQAMIDALPDAEEITEDNAEEVRAQLEAIDEAKEKLSDEEIDELDMTRYMEAADMVEQLLYGVATPSNAVMLADYDGPAIVIGTEGISGYDSTNGYDYIYYGTWDSSAIKWRVLDDQTNTGESGLFLLSDVLLGTGSYGDVYFDNSGSDSNVWQNSSAQAWCKDFAGEEGAATNVTNAFTAGELGAVLATTKSDQEFKSSTYSVPFSASENILNGDKVFFLSAEEAENSAYGFTDDNARVANYGTSAGVWWLRSPYADGSNIAGAVYDYGTVHYDYVNYVWAARPAFNLNLNSVLFTSAAVGGKADTAVDENLTAVGTGTGEWKLTLKDNSRSFSVTSNKTVTVDQGGAVDITYTGAETGGNEYVSAMIAQGNTILYYGRIANNSAADTSSVAIPADLAPGSYTLKVFSEQHNGDQKTDYASAFEDIDLTVEKKEQFSLTPGGTYYFDLSGETIPGTVNTSLPDSLLHYVPFTYAGTVDAYKLTSAMATTEEYANENKYKHSLFVADYAVTNRVSRNDLNTASLLFGKNYASGSVGYTLRAPSVGSGFTGSDDSRRGTPLSNEWDAILDKNGGYIKNWSGRTYSWGQDTSIYGEQYPAIRGGESARTWFNTSYDNAFVDFRPVLEVLNADTLGSDGLKAVTLDLGDSKLGGSSDDIRIIVKNGTAFTAPASDSLTVPTGYHIKWRDGNGNLYAPGDSVPADVTKLTVEFVPNTYTVTLNTNGGTINSGHVTEYTCGQEATLPTADDMTYTGHTFKGWYDNKALTGTPVTAISDTATGNKEYWAKWEENTYTVTLNGVNSDATGAGNYVKGVTVNIYAGTKSGYSFNGWTSDYVTITNANNKNASFTMPAKDVTVTANWTKNSSGGTGHIYYTIKATAGAGGTISPSGNAAVLYGGNKTFTITPDNGYAIADVKIDGQSIGAVKTYTFERVRGDHTIEAVFMKATGNPQTGVDVPFTDVSETDWFYADVAYVYANGLMAGTSVTTFSPNVTTTRGMIVTILYRLEGEPAISGTCPFDDVKSGSYYEKAITWAAAKGIVSGYGSDLFGPDDPITREQMAVILFRYAQYRGLDVSAGEDTNILSYNDALDISEYAFPAMQWICGESILNGSDGNLMPRGSATRTQVAAILHRFCENILK